MRYKFNKLAASVTLAAGFIVFVIVFVVGIINEKEQLHYFGYLIYGIMGLFASIISGFAIPDKI